MRDSSSAIKSIAVSMGSFPRILATSASVFPVSGFSFSDLAEFRSEKLKPLTGKTLAEVARMRGKDPIDTAMDLIAEDESRIGTLYFIISEDNVKKELTKPWISFGSDEASQAPEGVFLKSNPHPRAYGNFARVLGKYVRDEKVIPLKEAIRRLSGLPATNLGLDDRGYICPALV